MARWPRLFVVCILLTGTLVAASPATAASNPPTAISLAKKLVKAHVCTKPRILDPNETTAVCSSAVIAPTPIAVHAYRSTKAMRKELNADLADECELLKSAGITNTPPREYRVGNTWFMGAYPTVKGISDALGGSLRSYDCP